MSAGNKREFIDHLQKKEGKEQVMKCPLRFMGCEIDALKPPETRFICLKEQCAWWEVRLGRCAVLTMSRIMIDVGRQLESIQGKMPHAGQSTK